MANAVTSQQSRTALLLQGIQIGTEGDDRLISHNAEDRIYGFGGDDRLSASDAGTTLFGGAGADELSVQLFGSDFPENLHTAAILRGGAGDDTLRASYTYGDAEEGPSNYYLFGDEGEDVAILHLEAFPAYPLHATIDGGKGNDLIDAILSGISDMGGRLSYRISGGEGNDRINARAFQAEGAESHISGGAGNDTINAYLGITASIGSDSTNLAHGDAGDDTLRLTTQMGSNYSINRATTEGHGGAGNDRIAAESGSGGDSSSYMETMLTGGSGRDVLTARTEAQPIEVAEATNTLIGGTGSDVLNATAQAGAELDPDFDREPLRQTGTAENFLFGGAGNDRLTAVATVITEEDTAETEVAFNQLDGGAGNDIMSATIAAGSHGRNVLSGGIGNDRLTAVGGTDNLLEGGSGRDLLTGSSNADMLDGGRGADRMVGGLGDDTYYVNDTRDVTSEAAGQGEDSVISSIDRSLWRTLENLTLTGQAVRGIGNDSANRLIGNAQNNQLYGGNGGDMLTGGDGADTFIFRPGANEGADTITDFDTTRDRLDFRGVADRGAPGLGDDLSALATLAEAEGDVTLAFDAGTRIVFSGLSTGGIDELAELVADPGTQIIGWDAMTG